MEGERILYLQLKELTGVGGRRNLPGELSIKFGGENQFNLLLRHLRRTV